jgi:hypothetical protein
LGGYVEEQKVVPAAGLIVLVVVQDTGVASGGNDGGVGEGGAVADEFVGEFRLDLNLGTDANRDGLPDAWQEWQLYQAGRRAGTPGWDINLITKTGDFDGDGISNHDEYVAGTFAGDATERFELRITGKTETRVNFEFFGITGKVYTIEESADMLTWKTVPLATTTGGTAAPSYQAVAVGRVLAEVAASPEDSRFYRLTAR